MSPSDTDQAAPTAGVNRLLSRLPVAEYTWIRALLEPASLRVRQVLYEAGEPITHVYFPTSAVVSLLVMGEDGSSVETALVGHDGVVGLPVALGLDRDATQAICQISGTALRLTGSAFRAALGRGDGLRDAVQRYSQVTFAQVARTAACNRLHPMYGRSARWLLEIQDRVSGDSFPATHELLAAMLAVRRATITVTLGELQEEGYIRYRRGRITIVDRGRLEGVACECYRAVAEVTRWLAGGAAGRPPVHPPGAGDPQPG